MSPRVLFVAPSAYTNGGLATWLESIDSGLCKRGWQTVIGLVEGPKYHRPEKYLEKHKHYESITISCSTGTVEGRLKAMMKSIRSVKPDIVATVNIPDALHAMAHLRKTKQSSSKVTMTLHGFQEDLYEDIKRYKHILDGVICTNRLAAKAAERIGGIDARRVHYAPSGTKIKDYSCRIPLEKIIIAFVGRLDQDQKRILDIPEIARNLTVPFQILIAGVGPDEPELAYRLQPFVEAGSAKFLGGLNPNQLIEEVYSKANVLLVTSPSESGPIVAWEAMAHGLVVTTSKYTGSGLEQALVPDENVLMFEVGHTRSAAEQLCSLWDQPARFQRLSKNGYDLVKQRYSIQASISSWDEALRNVLHSQDLPFSECMVERPFQERLYETLRSVLGRQGPDCGPGGEWPHSHSSVVDPLKFLVQIDSIDKTDAHQNIR